MIHIHEVSVAQIIGLRRIAYLIDIIWRCIKHRISIAYLLGNQIGLPMCLWLIRSKFVPTKLGALGFVGYICLIAAMTTAASGFETASMALLLPGAAFEVMFGLILVLRGRGMSA
jgi:hypothetical protein